jgi:hypothetical protein
MKTNILGLGIAGSALVILVVALLAIPYLKRMFPGYTEGYATYDCTRDVTCPEGSFCQNNKCIDINAPKTAGGGANATGYYA